MPKAAPSRQGRAIANDYGLAEAIGGVVVGVLLESVLVGIYYGARHLPLTASDTFGGTLVGLVGLWVGFVGSAIVAVRRHPGTEGPRPLVRELADGLGLKVSVGRDLALGVVVGVASQYLLVPVAEAPLYPFVAHLYHRLGNPAHELTVHVQGTGLVVLGLFICLGSPVCEELFFRGLLLRALLGIGRRRLAAAQVVAPIVLDAVLFGLAHFEALQFIGLAAFGVVLCVLAYRTGRLGPGIVAHVSFNTVTFIALARGL